MILFLIMIIFSCDANGARHTQFLKVKPRTTTTHQSGHNNFFGFLPKGVPIPPSGPSQRHNAIGLDGTDESP